MCSLGREVQPIHPCTGIQDGGRRLELHPGSAMGRLVEAPFTQLGLSAGTNI